MHRPIGGPTVSATGLATYKLSGQEEWTLKAVTFTGDGTNGIEDGFYVLDCRDPNGGIIYLQTIQEAITSTQILCSLSPDAEPWADGQGGPWFPQVTRAPVDFQTSRLTPVTLNANCTVNVYAWVDSGIDGQDPITAVIDGFVIRNLHLWVEDAQGVDVNALTIGNPILIGATP
jgi:hypothetical protein